MVSDRQAGMKKFVARLNIEHYRKQLIEEQDEARRQTLRRLLAEEEAKLAAMGEEDMQKRKRA